MSDWRKEEELFRAARDGRHNTVKLLLQDPEVNPNAENNYAIRLAAEYGHHEIVKSLVQDTRVDPSAEDNDALKWAVVYGYCEVVRLLLQDKRVDPATKNDPAIGLAAKYGHVEIVRLLLQDSRVDQVKFDSKTRETIDSLFKVQFQRKLAVTWVMKEIGDGWNDISEPVVNRLLDY